MTQENDTSIEDILNSIKKFIRVEEEHSDKNEDVVRLSPVDEDFSPQMDNIDMPDFIKNALRSDDVFDRCNVHELHAENESQNHSLPHECSAKDPSSNSSFQSAHLEHEPDNKQEAQTILQDFASVVRELSKTKDSRAKSSEFKVSGNLDQFVVDTIKVAVTQWVEQNIKQIVESLVKEEISNITASIFGKSDQK
ncbi:MAG: DUF2497 domain-containing protein [Holosporales bacterium]|jgi:cell pole-organizing protein PopZ|nr:DUF2497 domain-containing protein [Holosporales bacterium]